MVFGTGDKKNIQLKSEKNTIKNKTLSFYLRFCMLYYQSAEKGVIMPIRKISYLLIYINGGLKDEQYYTCETKNRFFAR